MRTPVVAGNWKMNMEHSSAVHLAKEIHHSLKSPVDCEVIVAPPLTSVYPVGEALNDSYIAVSGQNIHEKESGAFTGEVSGQMLKSAGAAYVIIGHSERRQYFQETDDLVNKKVHSALKVGLKPIMCVGETLHERENGRFVEVVVNQVREGLSDVSSEQMKEMILAYEPVWAIGTGKTASPEQAEDMHREIRQAVSELYDSEVSGSLRILYGGSVKPGNAKELMALENVDGALVGGASLVANDFAEIIKSTSK